MSEYCLNRNDTEETSYKRTTEWPAQMKSYFWYSLTKVSTSAGSRRCIAALGC